MTSLNTFGHLSAENGQSVVLQSPVALFMRLQGWQGSKLHECAYVSVLEEYKGRRRPGCINCIKWVICIICIIDIICINFCQVGWTEQTGPCSMSASKTNKCYTLFQSHPSWENFLWSLWGTLGPFPSAWETSCTMGLPVTRSRARVTDAECGMSIPGPWHGPKQCSIKFQG